MTTLKIEHEIEQQKPALNLPVIRPCPFCGGEAELITRGNAFTKKRSAEIECSDCHTLQVTGAIHSSLAWCQEKAIEKWNKRVEGKGHGV